MRFDPPPYVISKWVRYVLATSFGEPGTVEAPSIAEGEANVAVDQVARMGLAPRFEARLDARALAAVLGNEGYAALLANAEVERRVSRNIRTAARRIAACCEREGLDIAFLKFAGSIGETPSLVEQRPAQDVDVLVDPADGSRFRRVLASAGFTIGPGGEPRSPEGAPVDVHETIHGLRLGRPDSAGLAELRSRGRLDCWRPGLRHTFRLDRSAGLAVTVVHALAHHGPDPASYRLLLAVADLVDARVSCAESEALATMAEPDVPRNETLALCSLAKRLQAGDPTVFEGAGDEARLLHHFVSPVLAKDVERTKVETLLFGGTRERAGSSWLWRALHVALAPRTGEPWFRRVTRPIRLLFRWGPRVARALWLSR